jgi:hypothetical protein
MAELGALAMRVEEEGLDEVLAQLRELDTAAKKAGAQPVRLNASISPEARKVIESLNQKFPIENSARVVQATKRQQDAQRLLNREIAEGTRLFSLQARTVDLTSKVAVAELRASAAAQQQWLRSINASTEAQTRFNAVVAGFEKRVAAANAATAVMPRSIRTGSSAMVVLALAASGGSTSLRELANSAGLVTFAMADAFAPAKWAG